MDDADREAIGTCYKQQGQDAAIALGMQRVSGDIKDARVAAWADFAREHPDGVLYCFRGGLRSRISQQLLYEQTGIRYPRVKGGYKAHAPFPAATTGNPARPATADYSQRPHGFGQNPFSAQHYRKRLIWKAWPTTVVLLSGRSLTSNPPKSTLKIHWRLNCCAKFTKGNTALLFEDESRMIGSLHLPETFFTGSVPSPVGADAST